MAAFDAPDMSPEQLLRQQIQQLQFTNQQLHQQAQQSQAQAQFFMGQQNQHFQNQYYNEQQLPPRVRTTLVCAPNTRVPTDTLARHLSDHLNVSLSF